MRFRAMAELGDVDPRTVSLPPVVWGVLVAVALFASVAAHELAHTLVALRSGARVRDITLMLLGGVSQMERLPHRPRVEGLVAAVGPLCSLLLAGVLYAVYRVTPGDLGDVRLGAFYLAQLNLMLGVFNLLPAFPMDGGRILRALLASRMGEARATRIAAHIGKGGAVLMAVVGLWSGNFFLLLIAFFLFVGAEGEARMARTREALSHLIVADVMAPRPPTISLDAPLASAVALLRSAGRLDAVVVERDGRPVGVVEAADVAAVRPADREHVRLRDLLAKLSARAMLASPTERASDALDRATGTRAEYLVVVQRTLGEATLVGLVGKHEMAQALALHELGGAGDRELRPRAI